LPDSGLVPQHDENGHDISFWMAFKQILTSPSDKPTFVLSSISMVKIDSRNEDDRSDQIATITERQY
jgi:hypothetical protein